MNHHEFDMQALHYRFLYSMTGLVLGLLCLLGGLALFFNGITGSISWTAKILGSESSIADAAPGAILFLVGLFIVIATRYRVEVKREPTVYGMREWTTMMKARDRDVRRSASTEERKNREP